MKYFIIIWFITSHGQLDHIKRVYDFKSAKECDRYGATTATVSGVVRWRCVEQAG